MPTGNYSMLHKKVRVNDNPVVHEWITLYISICEDNAGENVRRLIRISFRYVYMYTFGICSVTPFS